MKLKKLLKSTPYTLPIFFDEKENGEWVGYSKIDGGEIIFKKDHPENPFGIDINSNKLLNIFADFIPSSETRLKIGGKINTRHWKHEEQTSSKRGILLEKVHSIESPQGKLFVVTGPKNTITQVRIREPDITYSNEITHLKRKRYLSTEEIEHFSKTNWEYVKTDKRRGKEKIESEKITFKNELIILERSKNLEGCLFKQMLPKERLNERFVSQRTVTYTEEEGIIYCYNEDELVLAFKINSKQLLRYDESATFLQTYHKTNC